MKARANGQLRKTVGGVLLGTIAFVPVAWAQSLAGGGGQSGTPGLTSELEEQRTWAYSAPTIIMRARNTMTWLRSRSRFRTAPLAMPDAPAARAGITPVAENTSGPLSHGWTFWNSSSLSRLRDRRPDWRKRGQSSTVNLGLEKDVLENLTMGISGSFTHASQDTLYNAGHTRSDSISLTPYISYTPLSWLNLSLTGGYVRNRERLRWQDSGVLLNGRRSSNGYVFAATLEAARWVSNLQLAARAGLSVNRDHWKSFTDNLGNKHAAFTDRLAEVTLEGGAYLWLDPVMPYVVLTYTYDLKKPRQESDRDDITLTGGLAFYGSGPLEPLSLDLSGSVVLGRKSQRNATAMLGLRISF